MAASPCLCGYLKQVGRFRRLYRFRGPWVDMWTRKHFLISHAGTDHRKYAGIGIDHHFQERRAVKVHKLLQYGLDMIPFTDARGELIAVGSGGIDEVLPMKELLGAAEPLGEK